MALFASLPMYDWPEITSATDQYWQTLANSFRANGLPAPDQLRRDGDPHQDWLSPDCLFSQTCGLPYVSELRHQVCLIGSPAYDIDCGSGAYFSVIIVNAGADATSLAEVAKGRFAYNDRRSQSGFAAFFETAQLPGSPASVVSCPAQMINSGSHRASIALVAAGKADVAAIDAVSWELARRHDRNSERVRVLCRTRHTPGLPYITSLAMAARVEDFRRGVVEAMASLDDAVRDDLLLSGFTPREDAAYQIIDDLWQTASQQVPDPGLQLSI
jgi:ABC-type phosphate/phosphonate transport system substrate-binding protein